MLRDVRDEAAKAVSRGTGLPWPELYDAHAAELAGYLWKLTGDREAANDLMQDTFIAGMRDERALREPA
jgi:DNA-directed RNA polymerase specialized sigma24 family protein